MMRQCFDRHGSDKGKRHSYERVYEPLFAPLRDKPIRLLEVGVFAGASMLAWADYFQNAEIVGIDLFKRVSIDDVPKHERVTLIQGDSATVDIDGYFDIIIDDGSHRFDVQLKTFRNLIDCTAHYFIEDHWPLNKMTSKELSHSWLKQPGFDKSSYGLLMDELDKYEHRIYDLRGGNQPDSCIIEVRA